MSNIILTQNIKSATRTALNTIKDNEMAVFAGKAGTGKTTFRELLINDLMEKTDKDYRVAYYLPFRKHSTQTNKILAAVYSVLFPEEPIPANENRKMDKIKTIVDSNHHLKVILVIDNMQNLDNQTIREIKVINEEIHIPVVFFLMNDLRVNDLLGKPEIGYRINRHNMKPLRDNEVIQIAEEIHGLKFKDERAKKKFLDVTVHNPLTIKHIVKKMKRLKSFEGVVTHDLLQDAELKVILTLKKEYNISIRDIEDHLTLEGKPISRGNISETLNGKKEVSNKPISKSGGSSKDVLKAIQDIAKNRM